MKGLIIAAGQGSRLAHISDVKPLIEVAGTPILEHVVRLAQQGGITELVVVTGYKAKEIEAFLSDLSVKIMLKIETVSNHQWERENGLSVLRAKDYFDDRFILLMADHIFDRAILENLIKFPLNSDEVVLAIDSNIESNPYVDPDEATRVKKDKGRIIAIGKNLTDYNAFDTGLFLCSPAIFSALEESMEIGDYTLSGGIRTLAKNHKAKVMDIGRRLWIDIDDEATLKKSHHILDKIPASTS
jgi:choline kinase